MKSRRARTHPVRRAKPVAAPDSAIRAARPRHRARGRRLDRDGRSRAQPAARRARGNGAARGRSCGRARLSAARGAVRGAASEADAACVPAAGRHQPLSAHARRAHLGLGRAARAPSTSRAAVISSKASIRRRWRAACAIMRSARTASRSWRWTTRWCAKPSRKLSARGIPVLTMISDIPETPRIAYVGLDNRAAGRTAGLLDRPLRRRTARQGRADRRQPQLSRA